MLEHSIPRVKVFAQRNATATAASTAGNDQAQSPRYIRAVVARTQPTKKPTRRRRAPVSRLLSFSISGSVLELRSTSPSTAFVKLPVITAVEGATGRVKRKRAN